MISKPTLIYPQNSKSGLGVKLEKVHTGRASRHISNKQEKSEAVSHRYCYVWQCWGVCKVLRLSRGIVLLIWQLTWMHHDKQCLSLGSLVFTYLGSIQEIKMQLMYITIYYYYILLLLQYHILYMNTHLSVSFLSFLCIRSSSSSNS